MFRAYSALAALICFILLPLVSFSDSERLNYQGKLAHGNSPVTDTVPMTFQIYDGQSGTNLLYEESISVEVVDGYYSVELGENPNLGQLVSAIKREDAHIQVVVNGNALKPRERVGKPPFASRSTRHLTIFGMHPSGQSTTSDQYMAAVTNGYLISTYLANLSSCYYNAISFSDNSVVTMIFPPSFEEEVLVSVRFAGTAIEDRNGTATPTVTVLVRDLFAGDELRVLANKVDISSAQATQWFDIPLTNNVDARTIKPNEVIEVRFVPEPLTENASRWIHSGLYLDALLQ